MSPAKEIKQLQKAKSKAQDNNNLKEEANICNQLGELLSKNGDFEAAVQEHQQELSLSEALRDVIGRAVANRKIGECYAELGNIAAALKYQRRHLDLARSVSDHAEEQRALATIGRTYLFRYESDQSRSSLEQAEDAFKKSLAIVNDRLDGMMPEREICEMKARLFLNLGLVCDHLGDPKLCSEFIRRSVFIAEKSQLLEDLYRANFNLGNICFRNGQASNAVRCLEQAKECARKIKEKFSESECFHCIGKVQLSLGDFVAARRSLKKALQLGSQQRSDKQAVTKAFKYADQGFKLEEELGEDQGRGLSPHQTVELAEQLGDLCCKVGCYSKALDAYQAQLSGAKAMGKPSRELAVIHVSLAATYSDLKQFSKAVEHYKQELTLRAGSAAEECSTWQNIAVVQEEGGCDDDEVDHSFSKALECAQEAGQARIQKRVLRRWLSYQRRSGSAKCEDTEAQLQELCAAEGWSALDSEGEEEEDEDEDNSEPLEDSDVVLSDSEDDLEGYDKMVTGKRKIGRWNKRNEKGETSLHRACIDGNLKQAQYLIEQGHPVNPRDYCGWTPLHEASNHGHYDIVAVLLDRGAYINDPGGPLCEGVTPLHDALACGNLAVARLLIERGASVTFRTSRGDSAMDTLCHWKKTYSRELDRETKQECADTERLLKKALAGLVTPAPGSTKPLDALQDSQLFDAENSEPLDSSSQDRTPVSRGHAAASPRPQHSSGSQQRHWARGTDAQLLYGTNGSSSDSDTDSPLSPLRPVRPRFNGTPAPTCQKEAPPNTNDLSSTPNSTQDSIRDTPALSVFERDEYHSAIRGLGSAKSRMHGSSQFSNTPATSSRSALVPEEEDVADDWLEDDLGDIQPKKKRRLQVEQNESRAESGVSTSRSQIRHTHSEPSSRVPSSSSRGFSGKKKSSVKQAKMTQMPGMERLVRREVTRCPSPNITDEEDVRALTPPPPPPPHMYSQPPTHTPATALPPPIRVRVKVQDDVFLIPVPQSEADSCTVAWLCEQAAQRYYQKCGLLPRLLLQKEGALLSPQDPLLAVLHTNEEVLAEVCSWDLPPLPERYKKACQSLAVEENRRVSRLCEAQDGGPCVTVCGLGLAPSSLAPLLRALKLQASLTELRLSGNRLHDDLLPELMATAVTMPRLRLLDVSANRITGEGLERAVTALRGHSHPAFPCLEELDLSLNLLGDGVSEPLSCLLSCCPLLVRLSLQACGLTARFLQQHRLTLAQALTGRGHLKSLCLSHNALGATGFELVLKTVPLHSLTHLELLAVRSGPADHPALEQLAKVLSQNECSLTHLGLASNGLTDNSIVTLARCLASCPALESLDLSGNPSITSAGLYSILTSLKEAGRSLSTLNLQGCQVCGPWDSTGLDGLTDLLRDMRLCSLTLNKLDRDALKHHWNTQRHFVDRNAKCLVASLPSAMH
ncbi:tonsoku-like protein [Eucyclogobius newberryi]|uniref:tonsoku-like protein n=1 Tax=Eucyclogobius newberryi TaxID=166745 RepID=UPI003B5A7492